MLELLVYSQDVGAPGQRLLDAEIRAAASTGQQFRSPLETEYPTVCGAVMVLVQVAALT